MDADMPQPFSYRNGELIHGISALAARQQLAIKIAMVTTEWAGLENCLAQGFVTLLGGTEEGALAIYNNLVDRGLRETVYRALARGKLPKTVIDRVENYGREFVSSLAHVTI